jgi:hypothetical protein
MHHHPFAIVQHVYPESPAESGGLMQGDYVVEIEDLFSASSYETLNNHDNKVYIHICIYIYNINVDLIVKSSFSGDLIIIMTYIISCVYFSEASSIMIIRYRYIPIGFGNSCSDFTLFLTLLPIQKYFDSKYIYQELK